MMRSASYSDRSKRNHLARWQPWSQLVLIVNQNNWEFKYVVSNVVQNGLVTSRYRKDLQAKIAHPFVRVLVGMGQFKLAKHPRVLARWKHIHHWDAQC
jgi:hypothetical protein